jgi:hypothetical protein
MITMMLIMTRGDDDNDDDENDNNDDDDDVKQQLIEQIYLLDMSCSHIINTHFAHIIIIISTITIHLCLLSHHI